MMGITIWAYHAAGGPGPLFSDGAIDAPTMPRVWAWIYGIVASVGGISAGILNQSDFTRFARKQGVQVPGMLFSLFIPGMIVPLFGILTASASMAIYDSEPYWNPLTLISQWMLDDYSLSARTAAFICGLGFVISQIAENILGNGYAAGMDLAGLFPKYINIRRGCILAAILSWAVQPWLFYNTSSVLLAVAASFSVFLGPLTGVMMADYYIIRRQRIEVSQLYTGSPEGAYWFNYGFNWRAIISWVVCFAPALPGMIATINPAMEVSEGWINYYRGNSLFGTPTHFLFDKYKISNSIIGFIEAAALYTAICFIFKIERAGLQDSVDIYGSFSAEDARRKGMEPFKGKSITAADSDEDTPAEFPESENQPLKRTNSKTALLSSIN
jgi:NCS1 family nucleobase:cation symporter-1